MKILISGEIQSEAGSVYQIVMLKIEEAFNAHFEEKSFGSGLWKLKCIAIFRGIDSPAFDEVKKYRKKEHLAEFRLKIPLDVCLRADVSRTIRRVATSLRQTIKLLKEMQIPDFDCDGFESEFLVLARQECWID